MGKYKHLINKRAILSKGKVSPVLKVPRYISNPNLKNKIYTSRTKKNNNICSIKEIKDIKKSCKIAATTLNYIEKYIKPGVSTDFIDKIAHDFIIKNMAYPSSLNYLGYPKSICSSINEVICHGIPDSTLLQDGDIVNIDIAVYKNGMHGDTSKTFLVGKNIDPESKKLVYNTEQSLLKAISCVKPNIAVSSIGREIESYISKFNYGIVRDFTGHGIGKDLHTDLIIPHYYDKKYNFRLKSGMVFTIEPMITEGSHEWELWNDGWTVVTKDKMRSAQFEHTILVNQSGAEILTKI